MVVAMISWLPVVPMFLVLAFEIAALRDFGKEYYGKEQPDQSHKVGFGTYLKLIIGMPFFQIVLDVRGAPGGLAGAAGPQGLGAHQARRRPPGRPRADLGHHQRLTPLKD